MQAFGQHMYLLICGIMFIATFMVIRRIIIWFFIGYDRSKLKGSGVLKRIPESQEEESENEDI